MGRARGAISKMQERLTPPHLRALILGTAWPHGHYYPTLCTSICLATLFAFCSCVVLSWHIPRRVSCFWSPETQRYFFLNFCSHWLNKATNPYPTHPQMFFPLLFPPHWASSSILLSFFSFTLCCASIFNGTKSKMTLASMLWSRMVPTKKIKLNCTNIC